MGGFGYVEATHIFCRSTIFFITLKTKIMKNTFITILLLIPYFIQAQVSYVNSNATGDNNGTSWENAWIDLKIAIDETDAGEIWVTEGTYYPTTGTDREAFFDLQPNVNLFGGFPASGNPTWEQRDWKIYPAILSGDLGVANDTSDNSFHIMELVSWNAFDNTIDGFVFTQANSDYSAGGIDISGLFDFDSKVTIRNCTFRENYADYEGAGIDCSWTTLIIENCIFENNYSGYEGAAISFFADHFSTDEVELICTNSIFRNNYAKYSGGALDTRGNNTFYNCLFENNFAEYEGGALSHFRDGKVKAVNCTFVGNETLGDGSVLDIFSWEDTVTIDATFANCIFDENIGNGLFTKGGEVDSITVYNSLMGNCPPDAFCEAGNIFGVSPDFESTDDYHLLPNSPCVNAGNNSFLPADILTDLDGNERIMENIVDLGAYEYGVTGTVATSEASPMNFSIFPNPAHGSFFIKTDGNPVEARLINTHGQLLKSWRIKDNIELVNVEGIPSGLYLISIIKDAKKYELKILIH
jgi:hypothetical protein